METTKTKTLYEANIYCEMFYKDYPEWEERLEEDLPDRNLIFLTDGEGDLESILKDAKENHEEIRDFLEEEKENIADLCWEYLYPIEEGLHNLDEDECVILDNWCGED